MKFGVIKSGSRDAKTPESPMVISTYLLGFKAGFLGKMPLLITPNFIGPNQQHDLESYEQRKIR
jgi:hypothetical protein